MGHDALALFGRVPEMNLVHLFQSHTQQSPFRRIEAVQRQMADECDHFCRHGCVKMLRSGQTRHIGQADLAAEFGDRSVRHLRRFEHGEMHVFGTEQGLEPGDVAVVVDPVKRVPVGKELFEGTMA